MTQAYRNPENSWEVHNMLKDHPNRAQLIKRKWTEESLAEYLAQPKSLTDLIAEAGESENEEVNSILLDMEAEGLVAAEPDGRIRVTGTKEQLMKYGMDPTDPNLFERASAPTSVASRVPSAAPANPFGIKRLLDAPVPERHVDASQDMIDKYMTEYSKKGFSGDDLVLVHGGPGESPMMFPRHVFEKAVAHGEQLVEFTDAEAKAWRKEKGDKASVRFVLDYDDDKTVSTSGKDLDEAWLRNQAMIADENEKIAGLFVKSAKVATQILGANDQPAGWTLAEIAEQLGESSDRAAEIVQQMVDIGHVTQYRRPDGLHGYVLNDKGRIFYEQAMATDGFADDDPRLQSKQWFADINGSDAWSNWRKR